MNKPYAITCIAIIVVLVILGGCKQEPVTTTLTSTVKGPTQTMTAISTITAQAQIITITETQSVTIDRMITRTITLTNTSQTTTPITTQVGDFDPSNIVIEVINDTVLTHEKCKITSPSGDTLLITGRIYNTTFSAHVAIISCTFFDKDGIEIGASEEIRVNTVGIGSIDNFSIAYSSNNLAQITKCVITITI